MISQVQASLPHVQWKQLQVAHPGVDDDGIWFFWTPDQDGEVQAESATGNCPFLIETDKSAERIYGPTVEVTVAKIVEWLVK